MMTADQIEVICRKDITDFTHRVAVDEVETSKTIGGALVVVVEDGHRAGEVEVETADGRGSGILDSMTCATLVSRGRPPTVAGMVELPIFMTRQGRGMTALAGSPNVGVGPTEMGAMWRTSREPHSSPPWPTCFRLHSPLDRSGRANPTPPATQIVCRWLQS
jgi:hypothetical protein